MSEDSETIPAQPKDHGRPSFWLRQWALVAVVLVLIAAGVGVTVWRLTSTSPTPAHGFHVTPPADWKSVALMNAAAMSVPGAGKVVAALKQTDGKGIVVIRVGGKSAPLGTSFVQSFVSHLRQQVPTAKVTKVGFLKLADERNALYIAYVQVKSGTLTTVTVVPAGVQTYVIDTLSGASAVQTAREIGTILRSFTWY